MKQRLLLVGFLVFVLVLLLVPAAAFATDIGYGQYDEIAWKTGTGADWWTFVGDVRTTRLDAGTLLVEFEAWPGYALCETHVAVAGAVDNGEGVLVDNLAGIPHSKGGPVPGLFPYGDEFDPAVQYHSYLVDVSGMQEPITVCAHAVVARLSDGKTETGWATGCYGPWWQYPGRNWARYLDFPYSHPH